jgi:hypothetical protein
MTAAKARPTPEDMAREAEPIHWDGPCGLALTGDDADVWREGYEVGIVRERARMAAELRQLLAASPCDTRGAMLELAASLEAPR